MIEESIIRRSPVIVELQDGRVFEDRAKEIVKWEGRDHVVFQHHELTPLNHISTCRRARPPELTYAGKRV